MTSGSLQPRTVSDIASEHPEVEFALVLARTIDSVSRDPEQLRSAVYELARQKLDQLSHDDPREKARLLHALEVAIAGVEAHSTNNVIEKFSGPSLPAQLSAPMSERLSARRIDDDVSPSAFGRMGTGAEYGVVRKRRLAKWSSSPVLRYCAMLLFFVLIAGVVIAQRRGASLASFNKAVARLLPSQASDTPKPEVAQAAQPVAPPKPNPLLPTAYGVYAESNGKLFELQALPGTAPDPRVAISAAIMKPSETTLPDGKLRFVVFERQERGGASDLTEVRVIAQVKQGTDFDANGKPVLSKDGSTWVIRNISFPFRAAPVKEDPQMFRVESRDPDASLPPGRYALVIRDVAYDFTVAGVVTDKRQCLERISAANGVFYSECPMP